MEEFDDVELNNKLNFIHELFCETIYKEVSLGGIVAKDDLEEAINYFSDKEDFEKCIILKKSL